MDTIFALSSGGPPSGVAIIRVSGPSARLVCEQICAVPSPAPRLAKLAALRDPVDGRLLDRGILLWFPGPHSFTREDVCELHLHGSIAVVSSVLRALGRIPGMRMAEPGEFTRRAFENGKIDLTGVEAIADLIAAQTEAQQRLALDQLDGALRQRVERWRSAVIRMRAMVEAELDFVEEEDIPDDVGSSVWQEAGALADEIAGFLDDGHRGELVRQGMGIVLLGPPNSGKSSLLNALAGRDVAIVHEEAGTTRDIIEVRLDIAGHVVRVSDTAGIRENAGPVESEGIRRAVDLARRANLVIWLSPVDAPGGPPPLEPGEVWLVRSKDDEGQYGADGISVRRRDGLDALVRRIENHVACHIGSDYSGLVTRARHREALENCVAALRQASLDAGAPLEIRSEHLRVAGDNLGRIAGEIGVEDLLDVIFSEFCVGK